MLRLTEQQRQMARRLAAQTSPWLKAAGNLIRDGGFELSGYLAFMAFLAIFPFLIFLAALLGLALDQDTAEKLVAFLFRFAPSDVAATLATPIYEVMNVHRGDLLTLGIVGTLWAASSWFEAVRTALNSAYGVAEPRPFWWRRLQSLLFVVASAGALAIASAAIVLGPLVWQLVEPFVQIATGTEMLWDIARYAVGAVLFGIFLMALHRFLPRYKYRWHHLLPGIVFTLFAWLAISTVLSLYLTTIDNYESTYGALGGVVVTLLFFYSTSLAFIFGAELNASYSPRPEPEPEPDSPAA